MFSATPLFNGLRSQRSTRCTSALMFLVIFLMSAVGVHAQNLLVNLGERDSLGRAQGSWKQFGVVNYQNDKEKLDGVEGVSYGNYFEGNRVGVWEIWDNKGKLIGQRIHLGDTAVMEIQYRKNRIYSIIRMRLINKEPEGPSQIQYYKITEIIGFKRGKIRKRIVY